MSYILDALRRADAERERGAVPSLQSQQHTVIEEEEAPPRSRRLLWLAIALAGALVAMLAWSIFGGSATPPRPITEGSVAPVPVAPVAVAPAPPIERTLPAATMPSVAAPAAPMATPAPVRPAAVAAADARRSGRRAGAESAADPTLAAAPPVAASAARAETRVYAQAELPEEIRRELPKVAINGSSYSGDAASRMVMINGQIFHEGDKLGGGLVLDKINRRSAVLAYKGWRYEITF
jgi:general secretion pathway protein B